MSRYQNSGTTLFSLKNNNAMESRIACIKVKAGTSLELIDDMLYAGQAISLPQGVFLAGEQELSFGRKRILLTGVNHSNNNIPVVMTCDT